MPLLRDTTGGTVSVTQVTPLTYTSSASDSVVWPEWNITYSTNSSATTTASTMTHDERIWTAWNIIRQRTTPSWTNSEADDWGTSAATTACINYVNQAAWTVWNDRYDMLNEAAADVRRIKQYSRRQMTEAELLVELEREKKLRAEAEKRALEAKLVQERAERLLLTCLSPKQREDLQSKNCFYVDVPGFDGKVERYRIDRGTHGNIKQLDAKGSIIRSFCVQPDGVPVADSMLTQKLFIEADEETRKKFWETANITELTQAKKIPPHIPRNQRREYARANGLLH